MANIKNYGLIGVGSDVQYGKFGSRIIYDAGNNRFSLVQSDGTTLENVRFANVVEGTWQGTAISSTYGGTGQNLSASSGILKFTAGVASVGDVSLTADVSGLLPIANGGTGASTIAGARDALELGTIATQDANNVSITGGQLSGVDVTFTDLRDGLISITGFVDEDNMVSNSDTLLPTQQSVKAYVDSSLSVAGSSMNVSGDSGNGSIVFASETFTFNGTANQIVTTFDTVDTMTFALTNNVSITTNLTVGSLLTTPFANVTNTLTFADISDGAITIAGFVDEDNMVSNSATLIPTQQSVKAYVDSSLSLSGSSMNVAGDTGTGSIVFETETFTLNGTANEIETVFDGVQTFTIGLPSNVTITDHLTVVGDILTDTINTTDLTVTGNLSIAGNVFTVDSEVVTIADAVIRVNSDGAVVDSGLEANINGVIKQLVYDVSESAWSVGAEEFIANGGLTTSGAVNFGTLNDGVISITGFVDEDNMSSNSASLVPTQQSVKAYVDAQVTAQDLDFQGDTGGALSVDLDSQVLTIAGGTNISTAGAGQTLTVNLNSAISLTTVTASGTVSFGSLTDTGEGITVSKFVDAADGISNNNNDTTIPTSAAVINYVANNGGDGLMLRSTFTANSSATTFNVGLMPNVTSRTYYADKIVLKVGTAFAGGSFNHIVVRDNNGIGITLVTETDADAGLAGTYVIQLDGDQVLTKNTNVQVLFFQSNGSTPAVVTAGAMTATVHYNWI